MRRWSRRRKLPLGDWTANVFATAVDKHTPSSRTHLANIAGDAAVGQAKNRSLARLLTRSPAFNRAPMKCSG